VALIRGHFQKERIDPDSAETAEVYRLAATSSRRAAHPSRAVLTVTSERFARVSSRRPQRERLPLHARLGRARLENQNVAAVVRWSPGILATQRFARDRQGQEALAIVLRAWEQAKNLCRMCKSGPQFPLFLYYTRYTLTSAFSEPSETWDSHSA